MSKGKVGRNKDKYSRYKAAGTREINKARNIAKDKKRQEKLKKRREKSKEL